MENNDKSVAEILDNLGRADDNDLSALIERFNSEDPSLEGSKDFWQCAKISSICPVSIKSETNPKTNHQDYTELCI